jgi:DNA-directed RNA polymerase II subunit RPB2
MNLEKDTWNVISNYFESTPNYLTKHHLDSYNDFTDNKIYDIFNDSQFNPQVVVLTDKENQDITYLINIYYGGRNKNQVEISRPIIYDAKKDIVKPLYPNEARLKNLSYAFNIFCDIDVEYIIKENDTEVFRQFANEPIKRVNLGRIPIMLHSNLCSTSNVSREFLKKIGECPYDHGGYFIIEGREKVCVSRERKSENILYINKSPNPDFNWTAEVKSIPAAFRYARNTYLHVIATTGEIVVENPYFKGDKSSFGSSYIPLFVLFRVLGIESDKEIFEYIFSNLDDEFSKQGMNLLITSIDNEDNKLIYDQISALKYLEKFIKNLNQQGGQQSGGEIQRNRVERYALLFKNIYDNLFPHVGNDFREKALYLGHCVNQLLQVMLGVKSETDRDSFEYKRVDLSGAMIATLFRDGYRQLQYDVRTKISSAFEFGYIEYKGNLITNIINEGSSKTIFSPTSTEEIVMKGFRTGTLSNPGGSSSKKGVIQQIDRRGFFSFLGQIRRIVTPQDTGARIKIEQRHAHSSTYGYMCPMTIMDGTNVGVKKHLTCLADITAGSPPEPIKRAIEDAGLIPLSDLHPRMFYKQTKVLLNGRWLGVHSDPASLVEWIRLLRRNGLINIFVSISWKIKDNIIHILSDGGRCTRPVYIVNQETRKPAITEKMLIELKEKKIQWLDLVVGTKKKTKNIPYIHNNYYPPHTVGYNKNDTLEDLRKHSCVIEYLDNNDMNNVMISTSFNMTSEFVDYTHCEIHESMILSMEAQGIPFVEHNQFPRNVYGIGQSKQAISIYATNFMHRMDQTSMILSHPQRPINNTRLGKHIFNDRLGHGQNIIVAVCAYNGYNQEDSIICCQDAIDLGLLKIDYFKGYEQTERQDSKTGTVEHFYNPEILKQSSNGDSDNVQQKERKDYTKLDQYGFIKEGTYCKGDEIVIGKYTKLTRVNEPPRDMSVEIKGKGETISKVFSCYTDDANNKLVKIRTSKERLITIGDKIGSRYGQKGVLGITLKREDMPHTKDGIRPDIIINPGAFPKRMTNGHLIETLYSKLCAILGLIGDGTAFVPKNLSDIGKKLEEYGFNAEGEQILYDGMSGQQMGASLFMGPCFYQRFKQMVDDKIHSRTSGARTEEDLSQMGGGYTARERQPLAGRALGGGGRIGEMERDAILCHGIAGFLKETMMERSDKYYTHICENSGRIAVFNQSENIFYSPDIDGPMNYDVVETLDLEKAPGENKGKELQEILGPNTFKQSESDFFRAYMPYCAKLLIQECEGMGLSVRLRSDTSKPVKREVRQKRFASEMVDSMIVNKEMQLEQERTELDSLREALQDRFNKNSEDEDGEDDGEVENKKDNQLDEDNENENKNENENNEEALENIDGGSDSESDDTDKKQSGGNVNVNLFDYFSMDKDLDKEKENEPMVQSGGGVTFNSPLGEDFPYKLNNLNEIGNSLAGGSVDNIKLDPVTTSLLNMDRPMSPEMAGVMSGGGGGSNSGENMNMSGGGNSSPNSDIKIIELDPNYLMKDDSFSEQPQQSQPQMGGFNQGPPQQLPSQPQSQSQSQSQSQPQYQIGMMNNPIQTNKVINDSMTSEIFIQ